jgi:hypothetical protein
MSVQKRKHFCNAPSWKLSLPSFFYLHLFSENKIVSTFIYFFIYLLFLAKLHQESTKERYGKRLLRLLFSIVFTYFPPICVTHIIKYEKNLDNSIKGTVLRKQRGVETGINRSIWINCFVACRASVLFRPQMDTITRGV